MAFFMRNVVMFFDAHPDLAAQRETVVARLEESAPTDAALDPNVVKAAFGDQRMAGKFFLALTEEPAHGEFIRKQMGIA